MSRKTELAADLQRIGYQLGGAHLTRQARSATFNTFATAMHQLGYGIRAAGQIGGKHLAAFVAHRGTQGTSARTRANELSHLRAVLVQIGKQGLARNPAYGNRALGVERGSRIGTKQPLADAAIRAFQEHMDRLARPGIGVTLELQRALGLRETEAIRGGQADTLSRWQRELVERGAVHVVEGTKGGRARDVHPANVDRARLGIPDSGTVSECDVIAGCCATRQQIAHAFCIVIRRNSLAAVVRGYIRDHNDLVQRDGGGSDGQAAVRAVSQGELVQGHSVC
jgi:hypothetical protein